MKGSVHQWTEKKDNLKKLKTTVGVPVLLWNVCDKNSKHYTNEFNAKIQFGTPQKTKREFLNFDT